MTGKNDLKAYIRLDYSGRVVAGSLILRKKMPKVGNWVEVPANKCCNSPTYPTKICVSGFDSHSEFNGTYLFIEISQGKPRYQKDENYDIYWTEEGPTGSNWVIGDVAYSEENTSDPTKVTTWVVIPPEGDLPAPLDEIVVTAGECEELR